MKSVAAPLKNVFVSIKALNYFNGIDLGQSVQALQCGDTYVAVKRLYFKCQNSYFLYSYIQSADYLILESRSRLSFSYLKQNKRKNKPQPWTKVVKALPKKVKPVLFCISWIVNSTSVNTKGFKLW